MVTKKLTALLFLFSFFFSVSGMRDETDRHVAALIAKNKAQERWILYISLAREENELGIIEEIQKTLNGHICRYGRNEEFWFTLKGSEEVLLQKLQDKPWFDKEKLKKDQTLCPAIK